MNTYRFILLPLLFILTALSNLRAQSFSNTTTNAIPNPGVKSVPIKVSGLRSSIDTVTFGLQSVNVKVTHPKLDQVILQLQSPDGKTILLARREPGKNYNTTFDAVSDKFIDIKEMTGYSGYTGSYTSGYRPLQDLAVLNNGQNPNGTWNLIARDDKSGTSAGSVTGVTLVFGTKPAKPFLSSSRLPIIKIYTNGSEIVDDPKIPADMYIIDNGPNAVNSVHQTTYQYQGKIGIELRGNSSLKYTKKQYGLETWLPDGSDNMDVSLFGMPKQSDWVLSAVMTDKSFMRNVIPYQLAREMGWWASRTQYCELIVNDEYRGVYIFEEKIKRDKNRVPIEKLETTDVTAPNVTGGYIFALDQTDDDAVVWYTKTTPAYRSFQFIYPKADDLQAAQKAYLPKYVDSFEAALQGPNFQDPVKGFRNFAEDASFIDFFLLTELSKNMDSYRSSTYFYKKRGGKIVAMPLWDFDRGWGNDTECSSYLTSGYIYKDVNGCVKNGEPRIVPWWWARLLQDAKYKRDMVCKYNALRGTLFSKQHLYSIIDSAAAVLNTGAQQRNSIRWNYWGLYLPRNPKPYATSFAGEIAAMKTWINGRLAWLDADLGACTAASVTTTLISNKTGIAEEAGNSIGNVYPQPFKDRLSITINAANEQAASIRLLDINGNVLYQKNVTLLKGTQAVPLNVAGMQLANGLYFLHVNGGSINVVKKVLKE